MKWIIKCTEALGRTGGSVWDCLIGKLADQPWAASKEELKIKDVSLIYLLLGHAAVKLVNMIQ